jgi:hypothetical protein
MKRTYDKKEDIPKGLESLYKEDGGKYTLEPIEGLKPIEDFVDVQKKLTAAEAKTAEYETKFGAVKDWDFKDVQKKLDIYNEYETKGKFKDSKDEDGKLAELVKIKTAENQRAIDQLKKDLETAIKDRDGLKTEKVKNLLNKKIHETVFDKTKGQFKVYESCLPDIELNALTALEYNESLNDFVTRDEKKLKLAEWLDPMAKERAWYKGSRGDGDTGSGTGKREESREGGTVQDVIADVWKDK